MVDGSIVVCGRIGKASVGSTATEVTAWFVPVGAMVFVGVSVDKFGIQLVNKPARKNNNWTCKICFFIFASFWFDYAKECLTVCDNILAANRSGTFSPLGDTCWCVSTLPTVVDNQAGRDNAALTKPALSPENCLKSRRPSLREQGPQPS